MKYSADDIVVNKWAELRQTPDGKWNRVWDITLKQAIFDKIDFEEISQSLSLSHEDFHVYIEAIDTYHLLVSVTTQKWGWKDEFIFATHRMFEGIERLLGKMDTIQGESREQWNMWLWRKAGRS